MLGASLTGLVSVLISPSDSSLSTPLWYILETIYVFTSLLLSYYNHARSRSSSTIQLLFWPLYLSTLLIWGRTFHEIRDIIPLSVISRIAVASFGFIYFVFECVGPEIGLEKVKENPVLTANIFSIWTFEWMTPLLKKGVAQFITEDDLPPLPPKDESAKLGGALQIAMKKQ